MRVNDGTKGQVGGHGASFADGSFALRGAGCRAYDLAGCSQRRDRGQSPVCRRNWVSEQRASLLVVASQTAKVS
jgi:hypothetical protein